MMFDGAAYIAGRGVAGRRRDRRHAYPREMVPGRRGSLPQLAQHHACARGARRVLYASGNKTLHNYGCNSKFSEGYPKPKLLESVIIF